MDAQAFKYSAILLKLPHQFPKQWPRSARHEPVPTPNRRPIRHCTNTCTSCVQCPTIRGRRRGGTNYKACQAPTTLKARVDGGNTVGRILTPIASRHLLQLPQHIILDVVSAIRHHARRSPAHPCDLISLEKHILNHKPPIFELRERPHLIRPNTPIERKQPLRTTRQRHTVLDKVVIHNHETHVIPRMSLEPPNLVRPHRARHSGERFRPADNAQPRIVGMLVENKQALPRPVFRRGGRGRSRGRRTWHACLLTFRHIIKRHHACTTAPCKRFARLSKKAVHHRKQTKHATPSTHAVHKNTDG